MCEFCESGKNINAEYRGEGILTMKTMIDRMFGAMSDDSFKVAHIEQDKLWVDNSSGEYAELGFKINYCPFCGAVLEHQRGEA